MAIFGWDTLKESGTLHAECDGNLAIIGGRDAPCFRTKQGEQNGKNGIGSHRRAPVGLFSEGKLGVESEAKNLMVVPRGGIGTTRHLHFQSQVQPTGVTWAPPLPMAGNAGRRERRGYNCSICGCPERGPLHRARARFGLGPGAQHARCIGVHREERSGCAAPGSASFCRRCCQIAAVKSSRAAAPLRKRIGSTGPAVAAARSAARVRRTARTPL